MKRSAKLTPPIALPMGGIRMSLTMEVTILPKAAPRTTPTARSTTLPRMANSLNSFSIPIDVPFSQMSSNSLRLDERRDDVAHEESCQITSAVQNLACQALTADH